MELLDRMKGLVKPDWSTFSNEKNEPMPCFTIIHYAYQ